MSVVIKVNGLLGLVTDRMTRIVNEFFANGGKVHQLVDTLGVRYNMVSRSSGDTNAKTSGGQIFRGFESINRTQGVIMNHLDIIGAQSAFHSIIVFGGMSIIVRKNHMKP
jgi:hypothetical protein